MEINNLAQEFNDNRFIKYVYISEGKRETGTVRWFDPEKGYGFIKRDIGGDAFVHNSAVNEVLRTGQRVEYLVVHDKKGPKAQDVNSLQ